MADEEVPAPGAAPPTGLRSRPPRRRARHGRSDVPDGSRVPGDERAPDPTRALRPRIAAGVERDAGLGQARVRPRPREADAAPRCASLRADVARGRAVRALLRPRGRDRPAAAP